MTSVEKYYNEQKNKAQEAIFQMSDHENYLKMVSEVGQLEADKIHIEYLTDVYNQWIIDNPSLKIFSATIHMDETRDGAPHLHLDFLPVAESTRGLAVKVSMDGAMKKLGYIREPKQKFSETPYKQWLTSQREQVEKLGEKYINVIPSEPCVVGHQQPQEWKAQEQKRNAVQKLTEAFTSKKTIASAQAIIDNAEDIRLLAKQEAKKIKDNAKVQQLKAEKLQSQINQREVALADPERCIRQKAEELAKRITINRENELIRQLTTKCDELSKNNSEVHSVNKKMALLIEELYFKYTGKTLPAGDIYKKFKSEQKNKGLAR